MNEDFLAVVETKRFLGREFLTWLVHTIEEGGGKITRDTDVIEMALGDRVVLAGTGMDKPRLTVAGTGDLRPEMGAGLRRGKLRAAREAFGDCFRETFGVTPVPLIPYLAAEHVGLQGRQVEAVRAVEPASLVVVDTAAEAAARIEVPHLPLAAAAPAPVVAYDEDDTGEEEELFE